jgi:hypothetical protein
MAQFRKKGLFGHPSHSRSSSDRQRGREAGTAEVCSDCGHMRLRLLPWIRRARRRPVIPEPGKGPGLDGMHEIEKCDRCRKPRLYMWRVLRSDEVGKFRRTGPPTPQVEDELLAAVAAEPEVRRAIVHGLLTARPGALGSRPPDLSDRDLIAALRVAQYFRGSDNWRERHKAILDLLLPDRFNAPPKTDDVRRCRLVLRQAESYWRIDTKPLRDELGRREVEWKQSPRNENRKAGRHRTEHTIRVLMAVRLLKKCGQRRAENLVAEVLKTIPGRYVSPASIKRTIAKLRSSRGKEKFDEWCENQLRCWLLLLAPYLITHVRSFSS